MRRYRNARYAPESLERKLSPSSIGVADPVPVTTVMAAAPAASVDTSTVIVDGSQGYGFDMTGYSVDYTTVLDPSGGPAPAWSAPATDCLLVDGEAPPFPGEGPPPTELPPFIPTGPAVPAYV